MLICIIAICGTLGLTACGGEKNITVVARDQGSGTREAFDKVVTDGNGSYLQMKNPAGKTVYNTTDKADLMKETGTVMSKVASDKNAIGYISLGSVNDTIKVVKVNNDNAAITDLTLAQLYDIYTGKITKFSEIK